MGALRARRRRLTGLLVLAALAVPPAAAHAGSLWTQVTATGGENIDQVGMLRTADGVLHLAWHVQDGNTEDLFQTPISPSGAVGPRSAIVTGWATMENPALAAAPSDAIRVFFGGIRSTDPTETNADLNEATSSDGGATWTLQPGDVSSGDHAAYASPVSAIAVGPSLTPYETWFGSLGVWVHAGLSPGTPDQNYQGPLGNYGYDSNLASDDAGHIVLAWYSNATGHLGVYAQLVGADGSPVGSAVNMPDTSDMSVGQLGRTPLVARPGGGFYIAYATGYPAQDWIRLWHVGSSTAPLITKVPSTGGEPYATVAAAADGRLWVVWKQDVNDHPHVFAERSNRAVTRFGAVVDGGAPPGAFSAYRVDASAIGGALDVLGSFSQGTSSSVSTWYARLLPGLSLSAHVGRVHHGRARVTFTVTDAGDPVGGARVSVAGHSGHTGPSGKVTLSLGLRRSASAVASASGYSTASLRLRVAR